MAASQADDKKARDILLLEIEPVSTLADYFVIASVDSRTQMMALADTLTDSLKDWVGKPLNIDRDKSGHWTVLDYGEVMIHILNRMDRDYYQLERFWNHARHVPPSEWADVASSKKRAS